MSTTQQTSTAPADVLNSIKQSNQDDDAYYAKLQQEASRVEREQALLQKKVYDVANPAPLFMAGLVVAILVAMYIIYVVVLKPCLSGEWMDHSGNTWELCQNRFTGTFTVDINGEESGMGQVLDNYVSYGDLVGVWNYGSVIAFTEGWQLNKIE